jgi:hypothetical protein
MSLLQLQCGRLVVAITYGEGPDDARELVGEGDGGLVVAAEMFELEGPGGEAIVVRA